MKVKIVSKFLAAGLVMLAVGETSTYAERIIGVNYGPYHRPGQDPNRPDDLPITDDQFRDDLKKIVDKFGFIRTYGTEKRVQGLVPFIANNFSKGLDVYLGIYESSKWRDAPGGLQIKSKRPSSWRIHIPMSSMSSWVTNAWIKTGPGKTR